ncbi:DUF3299 domain-containing protein [Ruegeria sp. HKCCD8929]|uniref:DUF3299 domain-containing protein n=1 Tax=Ruegeria sp. HKCCD8929 TaxID=2683006 RepID=UPI0035303C21
MSDRSELPVAEALKLHAKTDRVRRRLLGSMLVLPFLSKQAFAEDIVELRWSDLLPESDTFVPDVLRGVIEHENAPLASQQPESSGIRTEWNGMTVRLPGFIVPIDYSGAGVTAFILVPYVGACVHVPPPPANQLVFVTTEHPYESEGLFEAVNVTGRFGVSSISTQLAEIGYALSADKIEPYPA